MKSISILISILIAFSFVVIYPEASHDAPLGNYISKGRTNVQFVMGQEDRMYRLRQDTHTKSVRWYNWMENEERKRWERKVIERRYNDRNAELCGILDADCSLFYNPKTGEWQYYDYEYDDDD